MTMSTRHDSGVVQCCVFARFAILGMHAAPPNEPARPICPCECFVAAAPWRLLNIESIPKATFADWLGLSGTG
jgi:hypothetical protein